MYPIQIRLTNYDDINYIVIIVKKKLCIIFAKGGSVR